MKRVLLVLAVGLAMQVVSVFAQPGPPIPPDRKQRIEEQIQSIKIWKLTETLELSEEQAAGFFPRYREYEKSMKDLTQRQNEIIERLANAVKTQAEATDLDRLMDEYAKVARSILDQRIEFLQSVSDVITKEQQAKLYVFEQRFPQRMRRIVDEMRPGPPPPRGPGMPMDRGPGPGDY